MNGLYSVLLNVDRFGLLQATECSLAKEDLHIRYRDRFFDQVRHETTHASSGNKHFFTK